MGQEVISLAVLLQARVPASLAALLRVQVGAYLEVHHKVQVATYLVQPLRQGVGFLEVHPRILEELLQCFNLALRRLHLKALVGPSLVKLRNSRLEACLVKPHKHNKVACLAKHLQCKVEACLAKPRSSSSQEACLAKQQHHKPVVCLVKRLKPLLKVATCSASQLEACLVKPHKEELGACLDSSLHKAVVLGPPHKLLQAVPLDSEVLRNSLLAISVLLALAQVLSKPEAREAIFLVQQWVHKILQLDAELFVPSVARGKGQTKAAGHLLMNIQGLYRHRLMRQLKGV